MGIRDWSVIETIMTLIVAVNENHYHPSMDDDHTRALVAGTLALMTHYAASRCPAAGERIRENRLRLSAISHLPWEFRVALAKLSSRWSLLGTVPVPPRLDS
jgi:hypothetical protein